MADTKEFTDKQEVERFLDEDYHQGVAVPPLSKELAASFYDNYWNCARISQTYDNYDSGRVPYTFQKELFTTTLRHLDAEGKAQMLDHFFKISYNTAQEDRFRRDPDRLEKEYLQAIMPTVGDDKEQYNADMLEAFQGMTWKARCVARYLGAKYPDTSLGVLKKVNLTSVREGEDLSVSSKDASSKDAPFQLMSQYPDALTFDEMNMLMKASQKGYDAEALSAYFRKADAYCQQQDSAQDVVEMLQSNRDYVAYLKSQGKADEMAKNLWSVAVYAVQSDPNKGTDLLAAALACGFTFEGEVKNNQVNATLKDLSNMSAASLLEEARRKETAHNNYEAFMKWSNHDFTADAVRYHPEKIDDILAQCDRIVNDNNENRDFLRDNVSVLKELMQDEHLSDSVRIKVASKMLDNEKNARDWRLVGATLDMVNGMEKPQGTVGDKLVKQLKKSAIAYAEDLKATKQERLDLNQRNNELKEAIIRSSVTDTDYEGARRGKNWISDLQNSWNDVAQYDKNKDKPFLSKAKAEELVAQALEGKKVVMKEIKYGFLDHFSSSRKQRIAKQNMEIAKFNQKLTALTRLPADPDKAKRDYRKALDTKLSEGCNVGAVKSEVVENAYNVGVKEMLLGLKGRIFADSTMQECDAFVEQKENVRLQYYDPRILNSTLKKDVVLENKEEVLAENNLIAKMRQYDDKATDALEQRQKRLQSLDAKSEDMSGRKQVVQETSPAFRAVLAGKQQGRA
jgi:hypothetical protein